MITTQKTAAQPTTRRRTNFTTTVTIPWKLNTFAKAKGVRLSFVLTEALKEMFGNTVTVKAPAKKTRKRTTK